MKLGGFLELTGHAVWVIWWTPSSVIDLVIQWIRNSDNTNLWVPDTYSQVYIHTLLWTHTHIYHFYNWYTFSPIHTFMIIFAKRETQPWYSQNPLIKGTWYRWDLKAAWCRSWRALLMQDRMGIKLTWKTSKTGRTWRNFFTQGKWFHVSMHWSNTRT